MIYVYIAMVLHRAGKEVNEASMTAVLKAAGVDADSARIKATVAALKNVNIDEVIKNAVVAAPASAPVSETKPEGEAKKEEPKEDKGKTEEEAAAGLGALFG